MLVLEGVSRRFGAKTAVDKVELTVVPGSFVGVIGRSGAGKSTLLRMINRLVDPSDGRIRCGDVDVTGLRGRELRDWRARCAMIFQQFNLVGRLDVLTNVLMGRLNAAPSAKSLVRLWGVEDKAIALAALEQFDIAGLAAQRADSLSGGQQQRVAIARAIATRPAFLLADEPMSGLDLPIRRQVAAVLRDLSENQGTGLLIVSHDIVDVSRLCTRTVVMYDGAIVEDRPSAELLADPHHPAARGLVAAALPDAARLPAPQA